MPNTDTLHARSRYVNFSLLATIWPTGSGPHQAVLWRNARKGYRATSSYLHAITCADLARRPRDRERPQVTHMALDDGEPFSCDSNHRRARKVGQDSVELGAHARSDHVKAPWEPHVRRQSAGWRCSREPRLPANGMKVTPA